MLFRSEIVGGHYVPLASVRNLPGLASTTNYPTAKLEDARSWFEDLAEAHCGMAFVPRYGRETLDGDGTDTLYLSKRRIRSLRSIKIAGVTISLTGVTLKSATGRVTLPSGTFTSGDDNVEVVYEHGYAEPPPALAEVALVAIAEKLMGDRSGVPDRALTMTTEVGSYTLSLAGENRPTGIPQVDAVLNKLRASSVVVR